MRWIKRFWSLLRSRNLDAQLDEELQFHLDARTENSISAGMSPQEARQDASRRFGNTTLLKEQTRESDVLASVESLSRDLRYALRSLRRSPGFTLVAILILALGIGANTAVFTIVNGVLLRPLPFPEPDCLLLISYLPRHSPFANRPSLADSNYLEFRHRDQVFEDAASFTTYPATLTRTGDPIVVNTASVTRDFFRVLRVHPTAGRDFLPEGQTQSNEVILGDKLWRSRFGADPNILGKTIVLDSVPHTVIGVMPRTFTFPDAELWTRLDIRIDPHNSFSRPVVGRLKPGFSAKQAQAEIETFAARWRLASRGNDNDFVAQVLPLKEFFVADVRMLLLVFAGAVGFVLLIACANLANLLLIRGTSRQQEISVRAALGASRWRLIRQLLTESILVSLIGGTAGVLLAIVGVPALLALAPPGQIPRTDQIHLDGWVLLFSLSLSILTGVIFGLAPAFKATRRELREGLNEGARTMSAGHERLRGALVISEIALALVLLTGAGLLAKSFLRMRAVNPGFRFENILTLAIDLPETQYRTAEQMQMFYRRTLEKLSALPGVASVAAVNWAPLRHELVRGDFQLEGGRRRPKGYIVDKPAVSPGYFRVMCIRLLRGREFTERDNATVPGVVVISHDVARQLWPGEDPIGKRIAMPDHPKPEDWLTIVGVVDDIRQEGLKAKLDPAIYQPYMQVEGRFFLSHMTFVVRTASNPSAAASEVRAVLQLVDRDLPTQSIATMQSLLAGTIAEPRFQTRLLGAFSALALLLAAIGIYGVLACSVAERTHEIGIRMALGAQERDVVYMVLRRTLMLAGGGVIIGMVGAVAATRALTKFLFEVTPTDPATFTIVTAILVIVAMAAALVPARRASSVYPLIALRHE